MNAFEFNAHLQSLPTRQLITAMRLLNGGPLGFDYMKRSKATLQEHALGLATRYAHANHPGEGLASTWADVQAALTDDKRVKSEDGAAGTVMRQTSVADVVAALGKTMGMGDSAGGGDAGGGGGAGDEGVEQPDDTGPSEDSGLREHGVKGGKASQEAGSGRGKGQGESGEGEGQGDESGDGEDGKDGEGKDSKGGKDSKKEPRKAPSTPQEMMAEALRQMMEQDKKEEGPQVDQKLIEQLIQKALKQQQNVYRVEVRNPDPLAAEALKDEARPRHAIFAEVLEAVNAGENVLLVGPAGCGKTFMAEEIARVLGKKFRFTGAVASEYKLLGFMNAQGVLVRTEYREAYEHGAVFLWDELDASSAQAMLSFNAGLANGHQDFPDTVIPRHVDFRAIASANTYGHGADRQYVGRNQMDSASLDRFYTIPMDYDESLEQMLYGKGEWVKYVQAARHSCRALGIRHVISMRAIQSGLRMLKTSVPRVEVERGALWKHLPKEDVAKIKSGMVGG